MGDDSELQSPFFSLFVDVDFVLSVGSSFL